MTRAQREQVVELLRCGADVGNMWTAARDGEFGVTIRELAYEALADIEHELLRVFPFVSRVDAYLETAACVEEKSWP